MKHLRHYCDGHEYRYLEIEEGSGEVRDNYGTLAATLETDTTFETVDVFTADGEILISVHANDTEVQTFEQRAAHAIGHFAASIID